MTQWLAQPSSTTKIWVCYPGRQNIYKLDNSDVVNFFVKTNDGRDRRLNFAVFVVWSVGYVLTESLREASHHLKFMGNWPTIIHTFLALSTQWISFPSRKWGRGVSLWFHLVAFVLRVNQESCAGESKIPNTSGEELLRRPSDSYRKFLDRVTFKILSNINDQAPQWKYLEHL